MKHDRMIGKHWTNCVAQQLRKGESEVATCDSEIRETHKPINRVLGGRKSEMNYLMRTITTPYVMNSRTARFGNRLVEIGFGLKTANGLVVLVFTMLLGIVSASAQTPSGQFFNGDSGQLGNSLRSITFFLAAAMIIAGIIFVAVGIITSGLRESLSTWKFITGAACFAFGGICAAVYAFSQGETVPLDNQF